MPPLKLLFHIFASISVIIATIYLAIPSYNRIVLFVAFSLIGLIFELATFFLKVAPVEIPVIEYSIELLPSSYAEGYDFDGIRWEKDFEEYRLYFSNKSRKNDIHDLRISVDMLGGIVQHKILTQEGCENLNVLISDMIGGGIGNGDKIITPVKAYSNNFKINSVKVFREGFFEVRLIVKTFPLRDDSEGIFEIKYHYADADGNMIKKSSAYKILVKNKKTLYIDIENPLKGNYLRSAGVIFDKPLVFKKGSVSIKGQSLEEPESIKSSLGDLKFDEAEFKKFKVFIGKDIVDLAKQGKFITGETFSLLPPMEFRTTHPDREYSCFDYILLRVRQVKDGFIYLDNEDQDRTVVVELIFNPEAKDGKFFSDFVKVNRNSKNYNIDHEISFYEFQKSLISNARLVFINLNNNSVVAQTHHFIPVNIDSRGSLENMDRAIILLNKIKKIEAKFNLKFKIPEKFSLQNIKDIEFIMVALDGKELKFGGSTFEFITTYDEAIYLTKNPPTEEDDKILFNNSPFELFDKNIELDRLQVTVPPCTIFPTIEQLELIKDRVKPVEVILKAINPDTSFIGQYLDFVDNK